LLLEPYIHEEDGQSVFDTEEVSPQSPVHSPIAKDVIAIVLGIVLKPLDPADGHGTNPTIDGNPGRSCFVPVFLHISDQLDVPVSAGSGGPDGLFHVIKGLGTGLLSLFYISHRQLSSSFHLESLIKEREMMVILSNARLWKNSQNYKRVYC